MCLHFQNRNPSAVQNNQPGVLFPSTEERNCIYMPCEGTRGKKAHYYFLAFESMYVETNNHEHLPHVHVTYG